MNRNSESNLPSEPPPEETLNALVSIAILRAEMLEDARDSAQVGAWREVLELEKRLAIMTDAASPPGGVARAGAVDAAIKSKQLDIALQLRKTYFAESGLPQARRHEISAMIVTFTEARDRRFSGLASQGDGVVDVMFAELRRWRANMADGRGIFPVPT